MKKLHRSVLCLLALLGFYAPQALAYALPKGISSYNQKYYEHAKQVLEQQQPTFLTDFQTLQEEIKTIDFSDTEAQFEALLHFLPAIEKLNTLTSFDSWDRWEGYRPLQCEVIFTFFSIDLPTADEGRHINVMKIFFDALLQSDPQSENTTVLSNDELMEKYNISREDAQRVLTAWNKLHRNWPW